RFVARGHEEHVRASFDFVRDDVVICDFDPDAIGIRCGKSSKEIFVAAIASAEGYERQIFAHDFVCDFGDEVETFLIGKAGNDAKKRAARNIRKIERFEKILLADKLAG